METPTRKQKFKQWVRDHSDMIIATTFTGGALGALAIVAHSAYKTEVKRMNQANQWADELNEWLNDEQNVGKVLYPLDDGRYLTVATEAPQQMESQ